MNLTEAINLAKQGRSVGWGTIINSTYNEKRFLTSKYLNNTLNKVLHDSYVKALTSIHLLKNPSIFSSWMGIIIANTAAIELRKLKLVGFLKPGPHVNETWYLDVLNSQPNEDIKNIDFTYEEVKALTDKLIKSLYIEQKLCILYHYYEGFSITEIAKAVKAPENIVISRLNGGIKVLRNATEELKKSNPKLAGFSNPIQLLIFLLKAEYRLAPKNNVPDDIFNSIIEDTAAIVAEKAIIKEKEAEEELERAEEIEEEEEEKNKAGFLSGNKKIIILAALIIVLAAGLTIHFVNNGKSPAEPANNTGKPSESSTISDTKPTMDTTNESSTENTSESTTGETSSGNNPVVNPRPQVNNNNNGNNNNNNNNSNNSQTNNKPQVTKPAATQPAATKPAVTKPAVTQPAATQPAATQPAVTNPPQQETTPPTPQEPDIDIPDFEIPDIE